MTARERLHWVGFSPDGEFLAANYINDKKSLIAIYNLKTARLYDTIEIDSADIADHARGPLASFTPSSSHIIYSSRKGIHMVPIGKQTRAHSVSLPDHRAFPHEKLYISLYVDRDGLGVFRSSWNYDGKSVSSERVIINNGLLASPPQILNTSEAVCVAISRNQSLMGWVGPEDQVGEFQQIHIRNLISNKARILTPAKRTSRISSIEFSDDSAFLAAGRIDGSLTIWGMQDDVEVFTVRESLLTIRSIAFRDDRKLLAFGSHDLGGQRNVGLVSLADGRVMQSWSADKRGVYCVAFDSSGKRLAILGASNVIKVYDVSDLIN